MGIEKFLKLIGSKDIKETCERFMNDEEFYYDISKQMLADGGFEKLGTDLKEKNIKESFSSSHMLKGIILNCGFTPLYDIIVQIVEPLRAGSDDFEPLMEKYDNLMLKRKEYISLLDKSFNKN